MRPREARQPLEVSVPAGEIVEVHVAEDPTGERRVDVPVLDPRDDTRAADDLLRGADAIAHLVLRADGDDPVTLDRDGPRPPSRGVHRVDVADEHQVRTAHGCAR